MVILGQNSSNKSFVSLFFKVCFSRSLVELRGHFNIDDHTRGHLLNLFYIVHFIKKGQEVREDEEVASCILALFHDLQNVLLKQKNKILISLQLKYSVCSKQHKKHKLQRLFLTPYSPCQFGSLKKKIIIAQVFKRRMGFNN